jgi:hypothetical protein
MGLFRKKRDEGMIDLGDGNVAISPERQEEMADQIVQRVLDRYEEDVSIGVHRSLELAVAGRYGPGLSAELGGLLESLARMGYGCRQFEDEMETTEAVIPWLAQEIKSRMFVDDDEGRDLAEVFAEIAVELCDTSPDDPSAPRSLDAIGSGMAPLRDRVSHKLVVATSNIATSRGMCEAGGLPDGVDGEEMFAMWRIGFLVRALEVSLPPTWLDPDVTLIVVDSEAAREAAYRWSEEHPDCTQEESDEAMKRVMLDPQFRIDVDDERVGVDPRFLMFELDGNGEIIPQPENDKPEPDGPTLEELERKYGVGQDER